MYLQKIPSDDNAELNEIYIYIISQNTSYIF